MSWTQRSHRVWTRAGVSRYCLVRWTRAGMKCCCLVRVSPWLCRTLIADGLRLMYTGGPYEDASVGMVQSARCYSAVDESGLGTAAQVWRHAAHCLAGGSGVF